MVSVSSLNFINSNYPGMAGTPCKMDEVTDSCVCISPKVCVDSGMTRRVIEVFCRFQKANEPVSWHVWCLSPQCHDSFTRMSVNSPTTSREIGCGQSVSDETCI